MAKKKKNNEDLDFKVGDTLVRFGRVYRIFKVKNKKVNGNKQKLIYFKAVYPKDHHSQVTCSIPIDNMSKTTIRKPFAKADLKKILKRFRRTPRNKKKINVKYAKEALKDNSLEKMAQFIRRLWREKQDPEINFSTTKKRLFSSFINRIKEELAYVLDLNPDQAKKKIMLSLEKSS
ncbi:MAG: hypothetical protein GF390_02925 [Candidatus Pacebacteria bacterium]|nr:hypothetical protein [Candidatus Paceibacterota bacterium]